MGTLKPLSGVIKLTLPIETPVIHVQGGFKVPMETGRNLEHTTERHQRGFKVPMETGSLASTTLILFGVLEQYTYSRPRTEAGYQIADN